MSYQQTLDHAIAKAAKIKAEAELAAATKIVQAEQEEEIRKAVARNLANKVIPPDLMDYLSVKPKEWPYAFGYTLNIPNCAEISFDLSENGNLRGYYSTPETPELMIEDDEDKTLWILQDGLVTFEDLHLCIAHAHNSFNLENEFQKKIDQQIVELEERDNAKPPPAPNKPEKPLPEYKICLQAIKDGEYTKAIAMALYELAYNTTFAN